MTKRKQLTLQTSNQFATWKVVLNTGSVYGLSDKQAEVLKKAILEDDRGIVVFDGFIISIPYIVDFHKLHEGVRMNIGVLDTRTNEQRVMDKMLYGK